MNGTTKDLQCQPRAKMIPSAPVLNWAATLGDAGDSPRCTQPALLTQDLCPTHTLLNQMHNTYIIHKKNTHTLVYSGPSLANACDDDDNLGSDLKHIELRCRQPS